MTATVTLERGQVILAIEVTPAQLYRFELGRPEAEALLTSLHTLLAGSPVEVK
jgi:hypothetical protein